MIDYNVDRASVASFDLRPLAVKKCQTSPVQSRFPTLTFHRSTSTAYRFCGRLTRLPSPLATLYSALAEWPRDLEPWPFNRASYRYVQPYHQVWRQYKHAFISYGEFYAYTLRGHGDCGLTIFWVLTPAWCGKLQLLWWRNCVGDVNLLCRCHVVPSRQTAINRLCDLNNPLTVWSQN